MGQGDRNLKLLRKRLEARLLVRGQEVQIQGSPNQVRLAERVVRDLLALIQQGAELDPVLVEQSLELALGGSSVAQETQTTDLGQLALPARLKPKTSGQRQYLEQIASQDITFGIGPAGTGKTYLAVAMAVAFLKSKRIKRIVLTRPAVEAGERLGFLPGDIQAKVDPYLRPLYDALFEMIDIERFEQYLQAGVIEVAPLAFMRGRAQPVDTPVPTPLGWRPLGSLQPGDWVLGSNGLPTQVTGVFPQGVKQVYRLTSSDGAQTLACTEHLWNLRPAGLGNYQTWTTQQIAHHLQHSRVPLELPVMEGPALMTPQTAVGLPAFPFELGREAVLQSLGSGQGSTVTLAGLEVAYLQAPAPWRGAYLAGLLSAASELRQGVLSFRLPSPQWQPQVQALVRSLGGMAQPVGPYLQVFLPASAQPFLMGRPLPLGQLPARTVARLEAAGQADCVCISVAAADQLYVTQDYLVTHNTLNDAFIILDEAQNTTPEQMKMFLTRMGFNSRVVITGDITQIDLPKAQKSGLIEAMSILRDIEGIGMQFFRESDVVRHPLVARIVKAYDQSQRESS